MCCLSSCTHCLLAAGSSSYKEWNIRGLMLPLKCNVEVMQSFWQSHFQIHIMKFNSELQWFFFFAKYLRQCWRRTEKDSRERIVKLILSSHFDQLLFCFNVLSRASACLSRNSNKDRFCNFPLLQLTPPEPVSLHTQIPQSITSLFDTHLSPSIPVFVWLLLAYLDIQPTLKISIPIPQKPCYI